MQGARQEHWRQRVKMVRMFKDNGMTDDHALDAAMTEIWYMHERQWEIRKLTQLEYKDNYQLLKHHLGTNILTLNSIWWDYRTQCYICGRGVTTKTKCDHGICQECYDDYVRVDIILNNINY